MGLARAILNTDGGARGNPGPAGIGVVLADADGNVVADLHRSIGHTTNNIAEYQALRAGLELALEHGVEELEVRMDSELVVSQVKGEWKIKNERLRPLAAKAEILLRKFPSARLVHVRREENRGADALANQAMDLAALDDAGEEPGGQGSLLD